MSPSQPPEHYDGQPRSFLLTAGTRLSRIHSSTFALTAFNPTIARSRLQGARFDATPDDPYGFLYAAESDATAVSEVLLRDLPLDPRGARLLPRARLSNLRIGWLTSTRDLALVSLRSGQDLAAVGQDTWLTTASAREYPLTRSWSAAIRTWAPWCSGLTWRSHREPEGFAYVFFEDRCPTGCLAEVTEETPLPMAARQLEGGIGRLYLERILESYRVALM